VVSASNAVVKRSALSVFHQPALCSSVCLYYGFRVCLQSLQIKFIHSIFVVTAADMCYST